MITVLRVRSSRRHCRRAVTLAAVRCGRPIVKSRLPTQSPRRRSRAARRQDEASHLGDFEIDHEFGFGGPINRYVARFGPVEDLVAVIGRASPGFAGVPACYCIHTVVRGTCHDTDARACDKLSIGRACCDSVDGSGCPPGAYHRTAKCRQTCSELAARW